MAVSILPNSAKILITAYPHANTPHIKGQDMLFLSSPLQAKGEVQLTGKGGDSAAGWTLGFIQAQWIETNYCYYRGQYNADGSIFVQRGKPPARPIQACRDCYDGTPVGDIFCNTALTAGGIAKGAAGATFPLQLKVSHFDQPREGCALTEFNSKTSKSNFLSEAQLEFHFCTVLSLRDPSGAFHHLLSFYWNLRWQAKFQAISYSVPPAGMRIEEVAAGTGEDIAHVITGAPGDRRFACVLTSTQTQSCNHLFRSARIASSSPGSKNRHEEKVWTNFDVRQP